MNFFFWRKRIKISIFLLHRDLRNIFEIELFRLIPDKNKPSGVHHKFMLLEKSQNELIIVIGSFIDMNHKHLVEWCKKYKNCDNEKGGGNILMGYDDQEKLVISFRGESHQYKKVRDEFCTEEIGVAVINELQKQLGHLVDLEPHWVKPE